MRRNTFFRDVLARVASVPGVTAAGINTGMHPFGGWGMQVEAQGGRQDTRRVALSQIEPGYLKVFGFRLLVNEAFVKRYLPERGALGALIHVPSLARPPWKLADTGFQVVGILRDMMNADPKEGVQPEVFVPHTMLGRADYLVVLTALEPASVSKAVAAQVYAVEPDQPVTDVRTVEETLRQWVLARPRFNLILFGVFAALGLLLATVGVYGVISNTVAQRTPEIGLRMALGAGFANVAWMVLRGGMILVALGLALGLAATLAAARLLASQMRDVVAFDPAAFAAVSGVMLLVGAAACFSPAGRAARIDPAEALRHE